MIITRIYKNSSDNIIRSDEISIQILPPAPVLLPRLGNDPGLLARLGAQTISSTIVATDNMLIDSIEIVGGFDDFEPSSGSFAWASKTLGSGQIVRFDMSNLPVIGDTIS